MYKFGIVLVASLFTLVAYAQSQGDPCAKFTNPKEKSVCNNMLPGLKSYRDSLTKKHAMPSVDLPVPPGDDEENGYKTIKLPPPPGGERDGVKIQPHQNIFQ